MLDQISVEASAACLPCLLALPIGHQEIRIPKCVNDRVVVDFGEIKKSGDEENNKTTDKDHFSSRFNFVRRIFLVVSDHLPLLLSQNFVTSWDTTLLPRQVSYPPSLPLLPIDRRIVVCLSLKRSIYHVTFLGRCYPCFAAVVTQHTGLSCLVPATAQYCRWLTDAIVQNSLTGGILEIFLWDEGRDA